MQRFTPQVKLYALDERRSGKTWKRVQQGIRDKFNTDPPSIRAMEKWEKEIDREKLSRMLIEESRKALPTVEAAALQQMAGGLIPVLWQARDAGEDVELEGWLWFFSLIEHQLGSAKFERFLTEYKNRRSTRAVGPSPIYETGRDIGPPYPDRF
jgi:hypothetical protein